MTPNQTIICGINIRYLGRLNDDAPLIVVVGRTNYKKYSASLAALAQDLHAFGSSVCWFEPKVTQTARLLDQAFESVLNGRVEAFCMNNGTIGRIIRKLIKSAILLMHPNRWDYFFNCSKRSYRHCAAELHRFLNQMSAQTIYILSHSAGGIVASLVISEPAVCKIACFGYPFKHPKQGEAPERTAHLSTIQKPFIMFQGDQDDYGSAEDAQRYTLSPSIEVISVHDGHDYLNLTEEEYQRCLEILRVMFEL